MVSYFEKRIVKSNLVNILLLTTSPLSFFQRTPCKDIHVVHQIVKSARYRAGPLKTVSSDMRPPAGLRENLGFVWSTLTAWTSKDFAENRNGGFSRGSMYSEEKKSDIHRQALG